MLCLTSQNDVVGEVQRLSPVDNLPIGIMTAFSAEGGPSHKTLEHDGSQGPPIAVERVTMAGEDLRGDVVGSTDRRVGHDSTRFAPVIDLRSVRDRQVDLINSYRVSVSRLARLVLQELLVVVVVVKLVKASGKTKIGQLDMAASVQENVVGLDITTQGAN